MYITMTFEEWKLKKANDKLVSDYLEKARQVEFAEEQSRESVYTRECGSIVDVDSV
jgi:hypothetical protein